MATAKKPGTISYKNTPDKKYGGEDTLTAVQKVNRGIRDSFKGSPAITAMNKKLGTGKFAKPAKPAQGIGKPVKYDPTKTPQQNRGPIKLPFRNPPQGSYNGKPLPKPKPRGSAPKNPPQGSLNGKPLPKGIGKPISVTPKVTKVVAVEKKAPVRKVFPKTPVKKAPSKSKSRGNRRVY